MVAFIATSWELENLSKRLPQILGVVCFWFWHSYFSWPIWLLFYGSYNFLTLRLVSIPWFLITTRNKNWEFCLMVVVADNFVKEKKQKCSCFPVCIPTPQCLSVSARILKSYVADIFNQPRLSSPFRCRTLPEYACVYFFLYILKLIYQQLPNINNRLASIKYFFFFFYSLFWFKFFIGKPKALYDIVEQLFIPAVQC